MRVAVIGAGKMGLPLVCQLAAGGARVTACDINPELVAAIQEGRMPFDEPGMEELLRRGRESGAISATTNMAEAMDGAEVVIVIIPVLLTAEPLAGRHAASGGPALSEESATRSYRVAGEKTADTRVMEEVTRGIAGHLRAGMMVCYETTLPVGTTRNRLRPLLEASGLRAGSDFDLVFSPERVKSQLVLEHLTKVPKIVGGVEPRSAERAAEFYGRYLGAPTLNVKTLEAAELAKIAGMIYRDVNIALANELAAYAEAVGVDFSAVRAAANTDGEAYLLSPGIGVGGHCTPVYPYFLLQDASARNLPARVTAESRAINDSQPARMLARAAHLGARLEGRDVLVLGLGFRPKVKEHTLSPAFLVAEEVRARGGRPLLHDPLYLPEEVMRWGFTPWDWESRAMPELVLLNTAHPQYADPDFGLWHSRGARYVVDGRNFWNAEKAVAAGLFYFAPGLPDRAPQTAAAAPRC